MVSAGDVNRAQALLGTLAQHGSKIQHIIVIVQENRTINNLFYGYPGAHTQSWGLDSNNKKIPIKPISLATKWDMQHNGQGYLLSCNGTGKIRGMDCRMNGFDKERCNDPQGPCPKGKYNAYGYVPHDQVKPYFDMANQYVFGPEMYASDFDISSFTSHQYIIAGVNPDNEVDYPTNGQDWGCNGGPPDQIPVLLKDRKWLNAQNEPIKTIRPCWDPTTIGDELDDAKLSWAYYAVAVGAGIEPKYSCGRSDGIQPNDSGRAAGIWSAYQAIKHVCYGPDWNEDVAPFSPPSKFLTDIKKDPLRAVTWITPTCRDSDHAGCNSLTGPSWVTSLVNAIGESPYWNTSAIFIFWDDPGGWYDPEPPQYLDNDGLGFRLPLLVISPYAKKGFVDQTHYEHGSILKFIEDTFGLPRLEGAQFKNASDRRANSPTAAFDFTQTPRAFVPIKAPLDANYFIHAPLDNRPPDND